MMKMSTWGPLVVAVAMAGTALAAGEGQKYGDGVTLTEATSIEKLFAAPEEHLGQTVRVDGVVSAVCENMGCWIELKEPGDGPGIRFKVDDGVIVFPISAKGKRASAQGVFEKVDAAAEAEHHAEHATEAAGEHAEHAAPAESPAALYRVKATGAVVY